MNRQMFGIIFEVFDHQYKIDKRKEVGKRVGEGGDLLELNLTNNENNNFYNGNDNSIDFDVYN